MRSADYDCQNGLFGRSTQISLEAKTSLLDEVRTALAARDENVPKLSWKPKRTFWTKYPNYVRSQIGLFGRHPNFLDASRKNLRVAHERSNILILVGLQGSLGASGEEGWDPLGTLRRRAWALRGPCGTSPPPL